MSDLNLNPRNIIGAINEFCSKKYKKLPDLPCTSLRDGEIKTRLDITINDKSCIFIVYIKNNGKVSIQIQGKDKDFGDEMKQYVIEKCQISENCQYNISFPCTNDFFNDFLEFLKNRGAIEKQHKEISSGIQYIYEAPFFDKITLHKYNNGNLFIQGKPLWLSQQINYYLSDKECFSDLIKAQESTYHIELNFSEVDTIFNSIFSSVSTKIHPDIKKMITTSIAFTRLEITNLPDYSAFTSPALRCLESFIQEIFVKNEIPYVSKEAIGKNFSLQSGKYVLNPKYIKGALTTDNKLYLENIYNHYHKYRKRLFHTDTPTNETLFIETKDSADKMIMDVCQLIKDGYTNL